MDYEVAVIGSGSAGKEAALPAAKEGCRVILIEKETRHPSTANAKDPHPSLIWIKVLAFAFFDCSKRWQAFNNQGRAPLPRWSHSVSR
jgi:flavin-dependent dehydrogenase